MAVNLYLINIVILVSNKLDSPTADTISAFKQARVEFLKTNVLTVKK